MKEISHKEHVFETGFDNQGEDSDSNTFDIENDSVSYESTLNMDNHLLEHHEEPTRASENSKIAQSSQNVLKYAKNPKKDAEFLEEKFHKFFDTEIFKKGSKQRIRF